MTKFLRSALLTGSIVTAATLATSVRAITVDGYLDPAYGSALATQTVNTSYGDATTPGGDSVNGSELDAAYGTIQNNNLYLFMAGNFQNNGNNVLVFIQAKSGGQSTLNITGGWNPPSDLNGSTFFPGFAPNYMFDTEQPHPHRELATPQDRGSQRLDTESAAAARRRDRSSSPSVPGATPRIANRLCAGFDDFADVQGTPA